MSPKSRIYQYWFLIFISSQYFVNLGMRIKRSVVVRAEIYVCAKHDLSLEQYNAQDIPVKHFVSILNFRPAICDSMEKATHIWGVTRGGGFVGDVYIELEKYVDAEK